MKTRHRMIREMVWLTPDSGGGFGCCSFGASFIWGDQMPSKEHPDWKSTVFVKGPAEKYSLRELRKLHRFSKKKTVEYDRLFSVRMGANAIVMDKVQHDFSENTSWLRKRMSWEMGTMYSKTLDEAIAVFMQQRL
jgi:hypothetical protein